MIFLIVFSVIILTAILVGVYNILRPLQNNFSYMGEVHYLEDDDIDFIHDLTYLKDEKMVVEQVIFQEIFKLIKEAEKFILIDFFLFNRDSADHETSVDLTSQLTDLLVEKKTLNPKIEINFITDPINNFYGSYKSPHIQKLKTVGVNLIETNLSRLRDSNPLYSGFWRAYFQWLGVSGCGWINHPFSNKDHKVTVRSLLKAFNSKANHRKVITADSHRSMVSIVTSANPHNASSLNSNIGFKIKGNIWQDILITEQAVAEVSGSRIEKPALDNSFKAREGGVISVQLLTEGKIRQALLSDINSSKKGGEINITMFYISDRKIVRSLVEASKRGVEIKIVLDPNKHAFGREKGGIPNRQVAYELNRKTEGRIKIRWFDTHGEQFHTKMSIIRDIDSVVVYGGSANLSRRNIGDFNLETDVRVKAKTGTRFTNKVTEYFDSIWMNQDGEFTIDFEEKYKEKSFFKYLLYRFQECSGISTF